MKVHSEEKMLFQLIMDHRLLLDKFKVLKNALEKLLNAEANALRKTFRSQANITTNRASENYFVL